MIKRKSDKLYVKWKGADNSFNSWIDKKDAVQKLVNISLNHINHLEETLMLAWIYLIMQQKLI